MKENSAVLSVLAALLTVLPVSLKRLPETAIKAQLNTYKVDRNTLYLHIAAKREASVRALFPSCNVRGVCSWSQYYYIADLERGCGYKKIHTTQVRTLAIFIPFSPSGVLETINMFNLPSKISRNVASLTLQEMQKFYNSLPLGEVRDKFETHFKVKFDLLLKVKQETQNLLVKASEKDSDKEFFNKIFSEEINLQNYN